MFLKKFFIFSVILTAYPYLVSADCVSELILDTDPEAGTQYVGCKVTLKKKGSATTHFLSVLSKKVCINFCNKAERIQAVQKMEMKRLSRKQTFRWPKEIHDPILSLRH